MKRHPKRTFAQNELDIQARYRLVEALSSAERRAHTLAKQLADRVLELERTTRELREANQRLEKMAHYDALTGVPNRLLLRDRFDVALARARRTDEKIGVLYIDLNQFKRINDTLGHDVGDKVLSETARRLRAVLREADTVSRIGGDEFVVLLEDVADAGSVRRVGQKAFAALSAPIQIGAATVLCSASIGTSCFPDHGDTVETLLRHADQGMFRAKRAAQPKAAPALDRV